jgi:hypothetical protein
VKRIGISVIAAIMAITGLFLANAPAYADGNTTLCESHGAWCVGAPSTTQGDPVVETEDGRTIDVTNVSGNTYTFVLVANRKLCVAADGTNGPVVLLPCTGFSGVNWVASKGPDHLSCLFQNAHYGGYLSGDNNGTQFAVRGLNALPGLRQQFSAATNMNVIGICGD